MSSPMVHHQEPHPEGTEQYFYKGCDVYHVFLGVTREKGIHNRFVRGLLGTGPPDPPLESTSPSPPLSAGNSLINLARRRLLN